MQLECSDDDECLIIDDTIETIEFVQKGISQSLNFNVTFLLFTRQNRKNPEMFDHSALGIELNQSIFDANRRTKFIIHGYMSGYKTNNWMAVSIISDNYWLKARVAR